MILVFAGFALYGHWRAPVPAVNEPHYLAKARHFCDATWCPRDVFLESTDAHAVFFAGFGPLTRVLSLTAVAYVGRLLAWGALAFSWVQFAGPLAPGRWAVVLSATGLLALLATGTLSGEWLVGGVESKSFAYAALFFALAAAGEQRWNCAAVALGMALSFHPIVGAWGAIALLFALGCLRRSAEVQSISQNRKSFALAAALCTLVALPGLVPAAAMLLEPIAPEVRQAADTIQVFDRLDHHLDPRQFSRRAWCGYLALLAVWGTLRPWRNREFASRLFFRFVLAALLIAAAGAAIGFGPRWPSLMKFYPFRLADVMLPAAVAIAVAATVSQWVAARSNLPGSDVSPRRTGGVGPAVVPALATLALAWSLAAPAPDRNPGRLSDTKRAAWRAACEWIARETAADALFLTPRDNFGFKWFAQRSEYACWKDCPQDARSLVEWKNRLDEVAGWRKDWHARGFSDEALADLRRRTGVDFVVDWRVYPYHATPIYENEYFAVFDICEPEAARAGRPRE
ncbi:MAG: DUF6798 domain-containing protein [Planctomycetaceae bacterium]